MKVLLINSVCGSGSTGKIVVDTYRCLNADGHDCRIVYGRGKAPIGINAVKLGGTIDVLKHVVMTRLLDLHGFASKRPTKKLIDIIMHYDPDVIHLHNIHGYYLNIELLFKYLKKCSKKVVWTLHDCWAFTGHCAYFSYINCEKWKSACNQCPQQSSYPTCWGFDNSYNNFQNKKNVMLNISDLTIVTPSHWLARIVEESFLKNYRVCVIHNGIDVDIFHRRSSNFREKFNLHDKYLILGVANVWEKRKGLNDFIELAKMLNYRYKIILVGVGRNLMKNLPKEFLCIAKTNNTIELAEIYSACDVYFNPTYEDNYPTTNLEAMACGTKVITYKTGGSPECISGPNDFIVEQGDLESVRKLLDGPRMASDSSGLVKSKEQVALDYLKLYNSRCD